MVVVNNNGKCENMVMVKLMAMVILTKPVREEASVPLISLVDKKTNLFQSIWSRKMVKETNSYTKPLRMIDFLYVQEILRQAFLERLHSTQCHCKYLFFNWAQFFL